MIFGTVSLTNNHQTQNKMKNSTLLILAAIGAAFWFLFKNKGTSTTSVPAAASTGTVNNAPYQSFAQALAAKGNSAVNPAIQNGVGASVDLTGAATAAVKGVTDFVHNLFSKSQPARPVADPSASRSTTPNRIPAYVDENIAGNEEFDRNAYARGVDEMMNGPISDTTSTNSGLLDDNSYEDSYVSSYDATLV
jgi:hypothetical protein